MNKYDYAHIQRLIEKLEVCAPKDVAALEAAIKRATYLLNDIDKTNMQYYHRSPQVEPSEPVLASEEFI